MFCYVLLVSGVRKNAVIPGYFVFFITHQTLTWTRTTGFSPARQIFFHVYTRKGYATEMAVSAHLSPEFSIGMIMVSSVLA